MVAPKRLSAVVAATKSRCRLRSLVPLALVAGTLPGCTLFSVVISPITGPVDVVVMAVEGDIEPRALWAIPFVVVLSPAAACVTGIMVDAEVRSGREPWEVIPGILRPWHTCLTTR
jgi:hypothetical protein